ncbi:hypothetical protein MLD38_008330 [Melastoma candidum]|uniref:Uncharacterized protein n=1 Tax=Melastoma candidum TaxID=119954 RepID=A0ACB9RX20_9MYRT|nr:hypothetical protein MLD38_008330 [Melastoma candidum]
MDEELLELQRQFEFAQAAKSSIRLSERNVVELVQKLQELAIIDFDLLHTVSGKEYITPDQLRQEMVAEVEKLGRVSLIDLSEITSVDLYHVEKQAHVVITDNPGLMLIQGEIISQRYWDSVAEEINERLQECSQIPLSELAAQLHVGSELLTAALEPRLGSVVKGRLEGGQLYTPAYISRISALVRGAARGITVPMNLSALWSSLQQLLQDMDGSSGIAVDASFLQSLFNEVLKEGEILGSLRAGVYWTPTVFAVAQKECLDSLFSQNSFIAYDTLGKLGIAKAAQFLQSRYPDGYPLQNVFVHRSLTEMVDASVEDAVERGSWIDSLSQLPAAFSVEDACKILSYCSSVQLALKSNKAVILGGYFVFSHTFLKDLYDRLEKEMDTFLGSASGYSNDYSAVAYTSSASSDLNEAVKESSSSGNIVEPGGRQKRGKATSTVKADMVDSSENADYLPSRSKKNQKKSKDLSRLHASESKAGAKKEHKSAEELPSVPSKEWIVQKVLTLCPDFQEQDVDNTSELLDSFSNYFRPLLMNYMKQKRKAVFTENAERIKRVLDNLQKKVDEAFLNLQLYEKALDLFDDDQSVSGVLHRHLLRTIASEMVDTHLLNLDVYVKLKSGLQVEGSQDSDVSLNPGERMALAKSFPGTLSKKALYAVEALEGKRVSLFLTVFREFAEESGLNLKKLDKKLERTLLHSYRKDLTSQVSAESDPVSLLPKVVSLLYIQVYGKALQAPGRAVSIAITRLKDKLDEQDYNILADYQAATVTLLTLISSSEDNGWEDEISSKKELLESLMPALKGLVLNKSAA